MEAPARKPGRPLALLLWGAVLLSVTSVLLMLGLYLIKRQHLAQARLPELYRVPEFQLTNQLGQPVGLEDLKGQVWIADIIFTRCAGPCPLMTQRMSELQAALPKDQPVKLVTLTTDAAYDTPEVLQAYARRHGANPERWWFLTGDPRAIADLAIDGLKFVAAEKPPQERTDPADLFVHSTYFAVIDQAGRARAIFHYDQPEMKQRLLETVRTLLNE